VSKRTDEEVELAIKLRAELKAKGLKGYVNSADDKERSLARRLIRDALAAYIAVETVG
jgi:hypothetical protein